MNDLLYARRDDTLFAPVGDDIVALNIEQGQCYGMADVSAAVWELLGDAIGLDAICSQLMTRFEVDADTCRTEVRRLLDQMLGEGLIERRAPSA